MSDTPETDLEANNGSLCDQCVPAEFARKLERERDEARFDLAFRRELYAVQELRLAEARLDLAFRLEQYNIKSLQLSDARKTILELQHKTL